MAARGGRQVRRLVAREGSTVCNELTLRAGLQPWSPKATEARQRRGAERKAMIETRGA